MTGAFWARSIDGPDYLLGSLALKPFGTYWGANLPRTKSWPSCHAVSGGSPSRADRSASLLTGHIREQAQADERS